jgi:hypothetical protein
MRHRSDNSDALFVRRGGHTLGPFPRALLIRYRFLGRLRADDEVSADGLAWRPSGLEPVLNDPRGTARPATVTVVEQHDIDWADERRKASLRWFEERSATDRRGPPRGGGPSPERRGKERRAASTSPPQARRFGPTPAVPRWRSRLVPWAITCAVLAVLAAVILVAYRYAPRDTPSIRLQLSSQSYPTSRITWLPACVTDAVA